MAHTNHGTAQSGAPNPLALYAGHDINPLQAARHRAATLTSRCPTQVAPNLALIVELVCLGYSYDNAAELAGKMTTNEGEF